MNHETFEEIVKEQHGQTLQVLCAKAEEYSREGDRFWNFRRAGEILGVSAERALLGMKVKHDVSVMDLVDRAEKGECISLELINKEFGGAINHLLLLKGMLLERCGLCSREFDAEDLDRERPSWTKPEKNADCGCR